MFMYRNGGYKTYNMPKYIPIDTIKLIPTKIIDGWQGIKVDFSRFNQLLPKMQLCNVAELRKRKWNLGCHLVAEKFNIRLQHLILF